jgi:NADPH:quinone reductase-like Zn-dependent oxidoreductase
LEWEAGVRDFSSKPSVCVLCVVMLVSAAPAQKVKVGYDKSVDFSKYNTYAWAEPAFPPTRPLLYATVVDSIDEELSARGWQKVGKDGDLTLIGAGGIDYGNNIAAGTPIIANFSGPPPGMNATMWTGAEGPSALMSPYVPQGTLALEFVDRKSNKVVWTGTVSQKLDIEQKNKSLELAHRAVVKLLKKFPARTSSSK